MKFSLIVPTLGLDKVHYLDAFLDSISNQSRKDVEVIIVDQNSGNEIKEVAKNFENSFPINYIKSPKKGLSFNRNLGLKVAKGEIIAFPDDDCAYPKKILEEVDHFFKTNGQYQILSVSCKETNTKEKLTFVSLNRSRELSKKEVFEGISSISFFYLKPEKEFFFDELLGLGSQYPSSEEFDFVFRLIKNGYRGFYNNDLFVLHPDNEAIEAQTLYKKVERNALGHGAFFRKHLKYFPFKCVEYLVLRPIAGVFFYGLRNKIVKREISKRYLIYRLKGFIQYKEN